MQACSGKRRRLSISTTRPKHRPATVAASPGPATRTLPPSTSKPPPSACGVACASSFGKHAARPSTQDLAHGSAATFGHTQLAHCAMLGFGVLINGLRHQILEHSCSWLWDRAWVICICILELRNSASDLQQQALRYCFFGLRENLSYSRGCRDIQFS